MKCVLLKMQYHQVDMWPLEVLNSKLNSNLDQILIMKLTKFNIVITIYILSDISNCALHLCTVTTQRTVMAIIPFVDIMITL